jgi:GAF domain-containing protein
MLEKAVRICEAKFGSVYRCEAGTFRFVANHNVPLALAEQARRSAFRPSRKHYFHRMLATKAAVQVADLMAERGYIDRRPEYVASVELGGVRTYLMVPILKDSELSGAFIMGRQEVRSFTDKQIELIKSFAAQAVIAIENARLLNELRQRTADLTESLEQQTATSEVLKVISSSPGDLQPVFATMLENAVRICDAKLGALYRREGDRVRLVAICGVEPALKESLQGRLLRPAPNTVLGRIARIKETVHIADVLAEQDFFETPTGFDGPHWPCRLARGRCLAFPCSAKTNWSATFSSTAKTFVLYRQANRAAHELCRPGRHRHRECAAAQ